MILFLIRLISLTPSNIEIEATVSQAEKTAYCELTFENLKPDHTYNISYLREDKTPYLTYSLQKKPAPEKIQLINFNNCRGILISLEDMTTKETSLYRFFPYEQILQVDGITVSLVSLDARCRNLLCKMTGFEPYEPFICQTTFAEQNIIEGTANADGTFTYLLSHTNYDKGANDPFALLRNSTKRTAKTNYLWGKALVRGKKNRIYLVDRFKSF